jgi:hypothetical protein
MPVDLAIEPWPRLARLAPPGTTSEAIQEAADRWGVTADIYAAAADLWEDKLTSIDLAPDPDEVSTPENPTGKISSVAQDGISITYAQTGKVGNTQTARIAQVAQIKSIIRQYRAKAKPHSPLVHRTDYNPWRNRPPGDDDCQVIIVDDV